MIDWSKMKTAEQIRLEEVASDRVTISRTQGLVWINRNLSIKDEDILQIINQIEDPDQRYEAKQYFYASSWDSNNMYVQMFGEAIGLDTKEKLLSAFNGAKEL